MGKKIYFKYGVMGSSKSLDLMRAEYNYRERGMNTVIIKSTVDTRDETKVKSRIGLSMEAVPITPANNVFETVKNRLNSDKKIDAVFVDDVHFFEVGQIDQLGMIADILEIPVLCYGLKSDFRSKMFPASKRLFEIADEFEEVKAMCKCGSKATFNARFLDGKPTQSGEQIMVGDQEYVSFCRECYNDLFNNDN